MKNRAMLLLGLALSMSLIGCCSKGEEDKNARWSKPQGVLEGCSGVMSNSQQCEKNPNNQQYMIQIERH